MPRRRGPTSRETMAPMPGKRCMLLAPLTPMSLVVSMRWPPAKWSPVSWCSERTIEKRLVMRACLGKSSVTSKPGTRVRIGFQMPRYSAGASGFMSYMSMWPGPPSSQIRMTEVFVTLLVPKLDCSRARMAICGKPRPAKPATPSLRKLRRFMPSQ